VTVLVDVGLASGAADTSQYWFIGNPTRGKVGVAAIAPSDLATSYSDRIMSMSVQRTSSRMIGPIVEYNAGTATVTLLDDDGLLDPSVMLQSPVGADLRIRKTHAGITYPVFRGTITSWLPEHRHPDHAAVVVQAVDAFDDLANNTPALLGSPVGVGELTGARVNRVLDAIAWPAADRDIAAGKSTLQGTVFDGTALELIQKAVLAEGGEFYADGAGVVVFRDRHAVLTSIRSNTSHATFGSDTAAGEIVYVGTPGLSNDRTQMANTVRATVAGGTQQSASDAASIARNRERVADESELLLQADADALNWAKFVLGQTKDPEFRFTSLTLDTRADSDLIYPQALGRLLADRITVVRRPPGGIVDGRELLIRSIEHTWQPPDRWITTWGLQPVTTYSYWTIGHPTLGRIGVNAIAY
jgi:hypothetical protein